ncbi:hypothetical protein M5D96_004096, partial [Drosophila gunungcola]
FCLSFRFSFDFPLKALLFVTLCLSSKLLLLLLRQKQMGNKKRGLGSVAVFWFIAAVCA